MSSSSDNNEDGSKVAHVHDTFYEDLFGINSSSASAPVPNPYSPDEAAPDLGASVHEQHCTKCINVRQCQKQAPVCPCPIVMCPLGCMQSFHACKSEEHEELLCPKAVVPCINSQHGCPVEMERRWTGVHLQTCPASVVVCTVEWNRKPLAPWQSEHFESWAANEKDLDIAATRRDEQTVKEYYKHLPQSLRSLLRTNDKKQAIMPLGVAGTRIPKSIMAQAEMEKFAMKQVVHRPDPGSASTSTSSSSESPSESDSEGDDSSLISFSEPSYGIRKSPSAGLQQSVCNQLLASTATTPAAGAGAASRPKRKSRVRLSPTVDVVVKDACKYMNLFTFMCAHEFRRDEHASHFRNVHTEIITQLNGWLWARCPMALQGCPYAVERMYPAGAGSSKMECEIIRNEGLDSFCVRNVEDQEDADFTSTADEKSKTEHEIETNGDTPAAAAVPLSICDLPVEILVHLTQYLDPLSLNALTLTNKLFLSVCQLIVADRGIVVLDWERIDSRPNSTETEEPTAIGAAGWQVVDKRWMFSTHFTPIRSWKFIEPGHMANHMANCTFLAQQRNRPSAPFCYPVTKDNLLSQLVLEKGKLISLLNKI